MSGETKVFEGIRRGPLKDDQRKPFLICILPVNLVGRLLTSEAMRSDDEGSCEALEKELLENLAVANLCRSFTLERGTNRSCPSFVRSYSGRDVTRYPDATLLATVYRRAHRLESQSDLRAHHGEEHRRLAESKIPAHVIQMYHQTLQHLSW